MLMSLTTSEFEEYIGKSEYSAVMFFAEHCPPSRVFEAVFKGVSKTNPDVNFFKVNIDNEEELAKKYRVFVVPTVIFFKKGHKTSQSKGVIGKKTLLSEIKKIQH